MTLCVIPFISITDNSRGDIRTCCHGKMDTECNFSMTEDGRRYNIAIDDISQAWNSKEYRTIRKDMLKGIRNPTCEKCYQEEDLGLESYRIQLNNRFKNYEIEYAENLEFKPQYVDLRLSSLCNLKCRMCTPFYSSQWVDEWNDLSKVVDDPVHRQLKPKEKINLKKPNWNQTQIVNENLQKLSKHANYINVSGGEPTIVKQNIDFLKMLIDNGRASNVTLQYETNLTSISKEQLALWKHFKHIVLRCSIDYPGDFIRYIRYPADWKTIETNFVQLYNLHNTEIVINTVVSIYSIMRISDMIDWANKFPKASLNLSLLENPKFLSIKTLPKKLKDAVEKKLENYLYYNEIYGIIKSMHSEDWYPNYFDNFKNYTKFLDKSRGEMLTEYLPEFKEYSFD